MAKIHTRTFRVRWSELDANGRFAPENYLRYLIETAYDWGDSLGLGKDAYQDLGIYWLIREINLQILDTPQHNDVVDLTIWMVNWQKVRGSRCFEVRNPATGQLLAQGCQKIVVMDQKSNRPTTLGEDFIGVFKLEEPKQINLPAYSFSPVNPPAKVTDLQVRWGDLDAQDHVNNAVYLGYARQAVAELANMRSGQPVLAPTPSYLQLQYSYPAVWGDILEIGVYEERTADGQDYTLVKMAKASSGDLVADCVLVF